MPISRPMGLAGLSILLVATSFWWQGHTGFNMWDEGYLWYGVQRILEGEVPLRDFMSYDPARYYWAAALLRPFNADGIIALRVAVAAFQVFGIGCALWLIAAPGFREGAVQKNIFVVIGGVICMLWMFPRHKLFDTSLSILLIGNLYLLLSRPKTGRFFWCGVSTGLAAVFGRNHGVYSVVGTIVVFAWLFARPLERVDVGRKLQLWVLGVLTGFSPILTMSIALPGFGESFVKSILFIFEQKATNLPLPIPWPWTVPVASAGLAASVRPLLVGVFFMGIAIFGAIGIAWCFWRRFQGKQVPLVVIASAALALPYAHFAYSRADVGHLAQGVFPLLIGCLAALATLRTAWKWVGTFLLALASGTVMLAMHPGWQCQTTQQCVPVEISGSRLIIDLNTANDIQLLRRLVVEHAAEGQSFIATPVWPGAYALFNRRSPMWSIYALWTRTAADQLRDIERIKTAAPRFALIFDLALDGREDLRFQNTNPLINQFIQENFDRVDGSSNPAYQIYTPKAARREFSLNPN